MIRVRDAEPAMLYINILKWLLHRNSVRKTHTLYFNISEMKLFV